ncbi:MAG: hypothetical protein RMH97_04520 [Verrucomicrobiales bacterium]|nr:hypothetical protein [Verrucomicrobiales bacterium]
MELLPSRELHELAVRLVCTHALSGGEVLYLAAALSLKSGSASELQFACADTKLRTAAEHEGLVMLP